MKTYLFVAGAFHEVVSPMMNKTKPYLKELEGSFGNPKNRIAAKGIADPELIWDRMILPQLGNLLERISPIFPPNKPPRELPTTYMVMRNAVVSCEKPISSNHMGAKEDNPDQGNVPATPWATIIWKDGIRITDFASNSTSLSSEQKGVFVITHSLLGLFAKRESLANSWTKMPTATLMIPTKWKASLHPGIPMNDVEAIITEQILPRMAPMFPVSCNHPKAMPRVLSSVESATRDWIAGITMASPTPFNALDTAT